MSSSSKYSQTNHIWASKSNPIYLQKTSAFDGSCEKTWILYSSNTASIQAVPVEYQWDEQ
jgi:hypothetical protein